MWAIINNFTSMDEDTNTGVAESTEQSAEDTQSEANTGTDVASSENTEEGSEESAAE